MTVNQGPVDFPDAAYAVKRCAGAKGCCSGGTVGSCYTAAEHGSAALCCDQNGRCCYYRAADRDPFWPSFSHPRWLSCSELYRTVGGAYDGSVDEGDCLQPDEAFEYAH